MQCIMEKKKATGRQMYRRRDSEKTQLEDSVDLIMTMFTTTEMW